MIGAIAAMQMRAFLNSIGRGVSKDPASTGASLLVGAVGVVFSGAIAFALFSLFYWGDAEDGPARFLVVIVFGLFAAVFAVLAAVSGEGQGVADARSLQLFPLSTAALIRLDLASEFLAPSVLMFAPAFAALAIGVALSHAEAGSFALGVAGAVAMLLCFLCNVTLIRIVSSLVVTSGRRLREWVSLFVITAFAGSAYLIPEIDQVKARALEQAAWAGSLVARATWLGATADLTVYGSPNDSGALLSRSAAGFFLDWLVMGAWLALLFAVHARVTRRLLAGETASHVRIREGAVKGSRWLAPLERLLPAPIFGIVVSDLRSLLRIPMMWILLLLPALFGIFLGGQGRSGGMDPEGVAAGWTLCVSAIGAHVMFSSPIFVNLFGVDREATALFLLAPLSAAEVFLGKTLSRLLFGSVQVSAFLAAASLRLPGAGHAEVGRAYFCWLAAALWVSSLGMILSVRMPFRMTFGQQKEQRFERASRSMLGQLGVGLVLIPPAAMILGGRLYGGESGYRAGIATTLVTGVVLWIAVSVLAGQQFEDHGPEMVEGLSARG